MRDVVIFSLGLTIGVGLGAVGMTIWVVVRWL